MSDATIRVHIPDLHCDECAQTIKDVMAGIAGIHSATLKHPAKELVVHVDKGINYDDIASWLSDIGVRNTAEVTTG